MPEQTKFLMIADGAAEHLRHLMQLFPHLMTEEVERAVKNWSKFKQLSGSIELMKAQSQSVDRAMLVSTALKLLEDHQMEDVMDILSERFHIVMDYSRLIGLIGKTRYRGALRHESRELQNNSISFQQMADLWNSLGKPTLGGERWTAHSVSMLVE